MQIGSDLALRNPGSRRNLLKRQAYFSLLLCWLAAIVPPIALHELCWRCNACGHLWEGESVLDELASSKD